MFNKSSTLPLAIVIAGIAGILVGTAAVQRDMRTEIKASTPQQALLTPALPECPAQPVAKSLTVCDPLAYGPRIRKLDISAYPERITPTWENLAGAVAYRVVVSYSYKDDQQTDIWRGWPPTDDLLQTTATTTTVDLTQENVEVERVARVYLDLSAIYAQADSCFCQSRPQRVLYTP